MKRHIWYVKNPGQDNEKEFPVGEMKLEGDRFEYIYREEDGRLEFIPDGATMTAIEKTDPNEPDQKI